MFKTAPRACTPLQIGKLIQPPRARTPLQIGKLTQPPLQMTAQQPYNVTPWSKLNLDEPQSNEQTHVSKLVYDNVGIAKERELTCENLIVDVSSIIGNTSKWPKTENHAKSKFIEMFKRMFIYESAPFCIDNFEKVIFVTKCAQGSPPVLIGKDRLSVYYGRHGNEALFNVLHELDGADAHFNTKDDESFNICDFFTEKAHIVLENFEDFKKDVDELKSTTDKSYFELATEYLSNHRLSIFEDGISYEQFTTQFKESEDMYNSRLCKAQWVAKARLDLHDELTYNGLKKGFRNSHEEHTGGSIPGYYYRQNAFKWIYEYVQSIKANYPEKLSKISLQPASASIDSNRIIESIVSNSDEPENYAILSRGLDMFAYCPQSIHIQNCKYINGETLWEHVYSQLGISMKTLPPKVLLLFSAYCDLTKAIRTDRIVPSIEGYKPSQTYSIIDYINDTYLHVSGSLNSASILSMLYQNPDVAESFKFAARFTMNRYHSPEIKSITDDEVEIQRIIKTLPHFS